MNTRMKIVSLIALICLGFLPVSAVDAAKIAKKSCGGTAVPNEFCSFAGDGTDVVIGNNSCNIEDACMDLANGVEIGSNACNGEDACSFIGTSGGMAEVGSGSCNSYKACYEAGYDGEAEIGSNSCNSYESCYQVGTSSEEDIDDKSCNAPQECSNKIIK